MTSYSFPRSSNNDFETWAKRIKKNIEGKQQSIKWNKCSSLWEIEIKRLYMEKKENGEKLYKVDSVISSLGKKIN